MTEVRHFSITQTTLEGSLNQSVVNQSVAQLRLNMLATAPPARAPRHGLTPKAAQQTNAVLMSTYDPRGTSQSEANGEQPSGHSKPIFRHTRSSSAACWLLQKVEQSLELGHWLATLHTSRGRGGALCHGTCGGSKIYHLHLNARMLRKGSPLSRSRSRTATLVFELRVGSDSETNTAHSALFLAP